MQSESSEVLFESFRFVNESLDFADSHLQNHDPES